MQGVTENEPMEQWKDSYLVYYCTAVRQDIAVTSFSIITEKTEATIDNISTREEELFLASYILQFFIDYDSYVHLHDPCYYCTCKATPVKCLVSGQVVTQNLMRARCLLLC